MKAISILHSGGPDSTLAALYALERADQVHLLTFHSYVMGQVSKHRKVVAELQEKFGAGRVISHEEGIDKFFNAFYFKNLGHHIWTFRTFYVPWICGACKLAMHSRTIAYNLNHKISTTYDGAHQESASVFPDQADPYMNVLKDLYLSYGMTYDSPIYGVPETDVETEKYGLRTTRGTKKEHVIFSTQHTCLIGLLVHAHARFYYLPFRGKNRAKILAGKFLSLRVRECKEFMPDHPL